MSIRKFASFVGIVFVSVILILVVAIGGAKLFLNGGGARAESAGINEHSIKMAGTAEVNVKPDMVKINLRLEALERTVKKAREVSSQKYDKLATQMKLDFQIKDTDLEILNDSITEEWNYDYSEKGFIEYRAAKSFRVTFTDFKKAELFYETAVDKFGCQIDSVDYDSTKLREYKDLARKNAVIAAKEKAQNMVQAIGQNIGKAIQIEESTAGYDYWYGSSPAANSSANIITTAPSNAAKSDSSLPKSLSSNLNVSYSVMVTFALE